MIQKYFKCEICGNIFAAVEESGVPVVCCGQNMTEMIPGTSDGAVEKHVPVFEVSGNKVTVSVGKDAHPMLREHYIKWISIRTDRGNQRKELSPDSKPEACFALCDGEELIEVYAYCNIHGLWRADAEKCC